MADQQEGLVRRSPANPLGKARDAGIERFECRGIAERGGRETARARRRLDGSAIDIGVRPMPWTRIAFIGEILWLGVFSAASTAT